MADDDDEISVKGKISGKDFEIKLKKGKKGPRNRRKKDRVKISFDNVELSVFMEGGGADGINLEWLTAEENKIGGWTGVAPGFSLRVHCPPATGAQPGDEPYVNVQISDKTREKWQDLSQATGLPPPPKGEIRVPITKEQQTALNDYFKDGELPKKLS